MSKYDLPYADWLKGVKERIRIARLKVAHAANKELLLFYWDLGEMMNELATAAQWGNNWIQDLSKDLRDEFPDMEGFSKTNLYNIKRLYQFYKGDEFFHQVGGKIPWRHHVEIFTKSQSLQEAHFYITETIENAWSRDVLALQIKSQLYSRQGKSISNFSKTLPDPLSDLAQQTLKDPYIFDFLSMTKPYHEKDIERQLVTHITNGRKRVSTDRNFT